MERQPFEGIKVLDLTNHIAGSFCCKQFADHGAEVIKIEKPGRGTLTRRMPPFVKNIPNLERSLYFLYLNTNKKSITLNLKSNSGKQIFAKLVKEADILIESFAPSVSSSLGLDFKTISKINPRLVMASITNFGHTGPYKDFKASDLVEYAMGGAMFQTGLPDKEPLGKARNVLLFETGMQATYAILGAYMGSRKDRCGDYIDISIMEAQLAGCERRSANLLTYQYTGDISLRMDPFTGILSKAPAIQQCKHGHVTLGIGPQFFSRLLAVMGRADLLDKPEWDPNDLEKSSEVSKIFDETFSKKTKLEWAEILQNEGLICTPLNTPEDVCSDKHWQERNFFVEVDHQIAGSIKYPRGPIRTDSEWWKIKFPAPLLGENNREVYGELGYSADDMVCLYSQQII
jgi:crotonobetainyl-CoA:carnitine CoA-transferase CaiB-like acyl-CoA transferase